MNTDVINSIKEKLLVLADERRYSTEGIYFTEVPKLIEEAKGEFALYAPFKKGYNPNVLLVGGISAEFVEAFNDLVQRDEVLEIEPREFMIIMFDQAPMYDLPLVTIRTAKRGKKHCWLPAVLKLKNHN